MSECNAMTMMVDSMDTEWEYKVVVAHWQQLSWIENAIVEETKSWELHWKPQIQIDSDN